MSHLSSSPHDYDLVDGKEPFTKKKWRERAQIAAPGKLPGHDLVLLDREACKWRALIPAVAGPRQSIS
jgi:hypothetical protein